MKSESEEQATAWLLSSLARRHIGYSYRVKCRAAELEVHSWVIGRDDAKDGGLSQWFQLPEAESDQFRLYLHSYPRQQVGCEFLFNVFEYPHKQIGTRRGRYRGLSPLRKTTTPILDALADAVARQPASAGSLVEGLAHSSGYSRAEPRR